MVSLDSMFEKLQIGEKIHDAPGQHNSNNSDVMISTMMTKILATEEDGCT